MSANTADTGTGTVEISCTCGAVKLRLEGEPVDQFYCHCDDCQAATGSPYVAAAVYPASALIRVEGGTDVWTLRDMPRHRCRVCGTHMWVEVPGQNLIGVRGERLPPGRFRPAFHIHCRYARLPVADALPHYAGLPPQWGGSDERVAW